MMENCPCVRRHNPSITYLQHHHVVPKSWLAQGAQPANPEIVPICGTSHDSVHDLLNHYVKAGAVPTKAVLRGYNTYVRALAELAWKNRPNDQPPFTLSHGEA